MAVVRVKASWQWFRAAAASIAEEHPRGARELLRAPDRPGRMAELTAAEAIALATARPADERAQQAAQLAREGQAREAARPRFQR